LEAEMKILNDQLTKDIAAGKPLNLELGGGMHKRDGYYNIDACQVPGVDLLADLNEPLSLIPDNSVASIFSNHVFEHVKELEALFSELHRITRSDGIIETVVPHFSNPFHYSDPTHVRTFGLYTMSYFVESDQQPFRRKLPCFYTKARFKFVDVRIEFFDFSFLDQIVGRPLSVFVNRSVANQEFYERRLCWVIKARQLRFKMTPIKAAPETLV
jgi:SAM-dependent methyltransferase